MQQRGAVLPDADLEWGEPSPAGSGFDAALGSLAPAERRAEAERRMRHRAACEFLAAFYRSDVANAKVLKERGVTTGLASNRIAFAKAGRPAEVAVAVTPEGGVAVLFAPGGKPALIQRTDLGEFDPMTKSALRRRIVEVVTGYLGVGG
jgi:hypothetical protein